MHRAIRHPHPRPLSRRGRGEKRSPSFPVRFPPWSRHPHPGPLPEGEGANVRDRHHAMKYGWSDRALRRDGAGHALHATQSPRRRCGLVGIGGRRCLRGRCAAAVRRCAPNVATSGAQARRRRAPVRRCALPLRASGTGLPACGRRIRRVLRVFERIGEASSTPFSSSPTSRMPTRAMNARSTSLAPSPIMLIRASRIMRS